LKKQPFIIWTLRRAGGTNLAEALFSTSNCDTVEHEPFNGDRLFGYVVKNWLNEKSEEKLYSNLREILSKKVLIKHCLEIIPHEVNIALAKISKEYGYNHLFLYREYPTNRLLSLNYSQKTNIWGKEHKRKISVNENIFNEPINIRSLVDHELHCRTEMGKIFSYLSMEGLSPAAVSFEDLYQFPTFEYSKYLVLNIFKHLDMEDTELDDVFLKRMLRKGSQGTSHEYKKFKNSEEFVIAADGLPPFTLFNKKLKLKLEKNSKFNSRVFEVWPPLSSLRDGECILQGILLVSDSSVLKIKACHNELSITAEYGLKSPRVSKLYPDDEPVSGNSRYILPGLSVGTPYNLSVSKDSGDFENIAAFTVVNEM